MARLVTRFAWTTRLRAEDDPAHRLRLPARHHVLRRPGARTAGLLPEHREGKSYDADLALADDGHLGRALYRLTEPGVYAFNPTATAPTFATGVTTRCLGQQSFQVMVLSAYGRRCAVTGERIRPVLQAAHILPVAEGGQHRIDNGLLLRSDVHTLFDRGYLGLDGDYRLQVSQRLRAEFGNGEEFFARAGERVGLPSSRSDLPDLDALAWHRENVFVPE